MEESDNLKDEHLEQVDQVLRNLQLDAAPPLLSSKVMDAIYSKSARVYINPWIIKMITAFFAGCIIVCFYYSDIDVGSIKYPEHKSVVNSIPPNLLTLLVFANIIVALFLLDRWLRTKFKSEIQ